MKRNLKKNGYDDLDIIIEDGLTDDDMESIGITLKGHRKKLKVILSKMKK